MGHWHLVLHPGGYHSPGHGQQSVLGRHWEGEGAVGGVRELGQNSFGCCSVMRGAAVLRVGLPVRKVQLQPWAVGGCHALGLVWQ